MPRVNIPMSRLVWNITFRHAHHALPPWNRSWDQSRHHDIDLSSQAASRYVRIATKTTNSYQAALARWEQDTLSHVFRVCLVRVWFGNVLELAVDMRLCTLFINQFVRGIVPSERKVVPWHSPPNAILSLHQHRKMTLSQKAALTIKKKLTGHVEESPISIRTAQQIVLKLYTQHRVLVTISTSGFCTSNSEHQNTASN